MEKILIISTCGMPVPAVKGGAVPMLIEAIIKENEKLNKAHLTVIGSYDKEAKDASIKYLNTKFIFIKRSNIFIKFVDYLINRSKSFFLKKKFNQIIFGSSVL